MRAVCLLAVAALAVPATAALAGHELDGGDIAHGQALYAENCADCHGTALQGQPDWQSPNAGGAYPAPPHDETGHTWHHSNQQNFDYVKFGGAEITRRLGIKTFTSGMPPFGDALSDDDIRDILAYIRSTWPKEIRDLQAMRNPPHE
ncbi:cytochrome c [Sagittula sp. M10.9X]|uniref:Cytochrome c n=2 Tax=Sagittula salina TaxID=2820268 RepID=A0A940S232_9RHOB|nr:cytochrome c [Sagittula salina]MBP0483696.1 cytochrome c [Sagittula salina]